MRIRRQSSSSDTEEATDSPISGGSDSGILRGLVRFFGAMVLISALALGTAAVAPMILDDLNELERFDGPDGIDIGVQPSPSAEPPPSGEHDPTVTDPDDPGESTYESDVETIDTETVEDFIHAEVNDRRADHDVEALEWDGTVASVARAHSHDMAAQEYFDHTNPDGEEPMERFTAVDDYCRGYGENIALTYIDRSVENTDTGETDHHQTAEQLATGLVDQWMNSTAHREAILEEGSVPDWDRGGVGVYLTDDGAAYASHNFCRTW